MIYLPSYLPFLGSNPFSGFDHPGLKSLFDIKYQPSVSPPPAEQWPSQAKQSGFQMLTVYLALCNVLDPPVQPTM
jgi:hypothetical protein